MTDNKIGFPILMLFIAILAWFEYRTIDGVLAVILLDIILGIIALLSIIPIIGWISSLAIGWYWVIPWVLGFTGVSYSWIITVLFAVFGILGFVITIIVLLFILGAFK